MAKTAKLSAGIWFNETTRHIHIAVAGSFISTVSGDPKSRRYHPNLYRKMAQHLKDAGLPYPEDALQP